MICRMARALNSSPYGDRRRDDGRPTASVVVAPVDADLARGTAHAAVACDVVGDLDLDLRARRLRRCPLLDSDEDARGDILAAADRRAGRSVRTGRGILLRRADAGDGRLRDAGVRRQG